MNFLTIEKFYPPARTSIYRKIVLGLLMLVVPIIFVSAWVVYSLKDAELAKGPQAETRQFNDNEITLLSRNN